MDTNKIIRNLIVKAPASEVWDTLTNPDKTVKFMFNCRVESDWKTGSSISWSGNYQGYESGERGNIMECIPNKKLKYTSFDPGFGLEDTAKNYLHITYELTEVNNTTILTTIIENYNGDAKRIKHIAAGWDTVVLPALENTLN